MKILKLRIEGVWRYSYFVSRKYEDTRTSYWGSMKILVICIEEVWRYSYFVLREYEDTRTFVLREYEELKILELRIEGVWRYSNFVLREYEDTRTLYWWSMKTLVLCDCCKLFRVFWDWCLSTLLVHNNINVFNVRLNCTNTEIVSCSGHDRTWTVNTGLKSHDSLLYFTFDWKQEWGFLLYRAESMVTWVFSVHFSCLWWWPSL